MATLSQIRRMNQRKVIKIMMRLGSASRAQLAKATGMSQATVGRIVDDLLQNAVLAEAAGTGASRDADSVQIGRPSTRLQLDRQRRRFLAVQLGVHQTRLAALPLAVADAEEWSVQIATPASPEEWADAIVGASKRLALKGIEAVVASLPGVVDEHSGKVLLSPNLRWTERADLAGLLKPITRAPLVCVQEIRALALGQLAAEPYVEDFLLVDFGSGVGAAAVIGGKLYRGSLPLSGELGHTPVIGNHRRCGCGATGCVETLVSQHGLVESAQENRVARTWEELLEEVRIGGLPAWMRRSLDAVATTIAGALNVLGLRRVTLTGALVDLPGAADYLSSAITKGSMWARFGDVTCKPAPRRRMAGMVSTAIDRVLLSRR